MNEHDLFTDECVKRWLCSLTILHRGHWDAARHFERVDLALGVATALTATISGTTAFAQLGERAGQQGASLWSQVLVGVFGILAAALAALQTFFRSSELAARHKQAAVKFGQLRRELEETRALGLPTECEKCAQVLTAFRQRWNAVDDESPPVPHRIYQKQKAAVT